MRACVTLCVHGCYQVQHGCSDILTCLSSSSCLDQTTPIIMEASMDEMRERWVPLLPTTQPLGVPWHRVHNADRLMGAWRAVG